MPRNRLGPDPCFDKGPTLIAEASYSPMRPEEIKARREARLAWWEDAPARIKERTMGESDRQRLQAAWRAKRPPARIYRCGDVWKPVFETWGFF